MTSFRYLLAYCIIYTTLRSVIAYEECRLRNGEQGYCRNIHQCESARTELKSRLKPLICGYDRNTPIVCCSITNYNSKNLTKFQEYVTKSEIDRLSNNDNILLTSQRYENIKIRLPITFPHKNRISSSKNRIKFEDSSTSPYVTFQPIPDEVLHFEDSDVIVFDDSQLTLEKPVKFEEDRSFHYPIISSILQGADDKIDDSISVENEASSDIRATDTTLKKTSPALLSNLSDTFIDSTIVPPRNEIFTPNVNEIGSITTTLLPSNISNNLSSTTPTTNIDIELINGKPTNEDQDSSTVEETSLGEQYQEGFPISDKSNFAETNSTESTKQAERECKRFIEYAMQFETRTRYITGGKNADYFEFPHMAALGYQNGSSYLVWKCGGSLISDQFVLTAAHCVNTKLGSIKIVRLGDIKTNEDTNNNDVQIYQVANTFIHPSYKRLSHYHDIAILQLDRPVNYSRAVIPACLQTNHDIQNVTLWATGWGAVYFTGDHTNILQKVDLRMFSTEDCFNRAYGRQTRLTNGVEDEIQICAGNPENGKDTCQGDSGGPLQIKMFNNKYIYKIVGITSFGKNCGVIPAVYTRVSSYMPWIEGIVWPKRIL